MVIAFTFLAVGYCNLHTSKVMARNRVVQWACLARTWWLYDANQQCPFKSAYRLVTYLQGQHKPLYHPHNDVGDHVIVYNTRHIAMRGHYWRTFKHFNHTQYGGGFSRISAWRVHEIDPTRIIEKAINQRIKNRDIRKECMQRLHLFPDEEIPADLLANVTGQIEQVQVIPKRLEEYSQEEIESFPKLFDWPEDYDTESYKRPNKQEPDLNTLRKWRID